MVVGIIIGLSATLLAGLVYAEKTGEPGWILLFKTPLSLLFIFAWTLQPAQHPAFSRLILIALSFCLGGDILLGFGSKRTFLGGLVCFLLGHVMYAAAFFMVAEIIPFMAVGMIVFMISAAIIWRWLEPYAGDMKIPVLAYIVVISVMMCGAFGIIGQRAIPVYARGCVFAGAILFYISDIFVARQRFVVGAQVNRVIGLPLYYAAQFLLAFSAAWIPW